MAMASRSGKRARTESDGKGGEEGEPVAVAAGFEAPIFGARAVGQVTTLVLEGEDRPLASSCMASQAITRAAGTIRLGLGAARLVGWARAHRCNLRGLPRYFRQLGRQRKVCGGRRQRDDRRVEVATGAVTTLAGSSEEGDADGVGGAAQFSEPYSLAVSLDGSALFVGDCGNNKIGGWRWRRVL